MRPFVVCVLAAVLPAVAAAQSGFDGHGAYLAPQRGELRDLMTIQRPDRFLAGDAHGTAVLEIARGVWQPDADARAAQLVLNGVTGIAIQDRIRLDAAAPVYLLSSGAGGPDRPLLGDLRLSSQVVLVQPTPRRSGGDGFGLGAVPWVTVPTGDPDVGVGSEGLTAGALGNATWGGRVLTVTGQAGVAVRGDVERREELGEVGLGVVWHGLDRVAVGLEGRAHARLARRTDPLKAPAEVLLSVRQSSGRGPHWIGGVGAAVRQGPGSPAMRVFLGGGFGRARDLDPDGDFIYGVADRCPDEPESWNGWRDDDGCPDALADIAVVPMHGDAVRTGATVTVTGEAGAKTGTGVVLVDGRTPGERWTARAELACLQGEAREVGVSEGENVILVRMKPIFSSRLRFLVVDPGGRPIQGAQVRWLDDGPGCSSVERLELPAGLGEVELGAGTHRVRVEGPGFAARVLDMRVPSGIDEAVEVVLEPRILSVGGRPQPIGERVHFALDRADLLPFTTPILDAIAGVVRERPELGVVEVVGHADDRGTSDYNLALSRRRAEVVAERLMRLGVAPERLRLRGEGDRRPLVRASSEVGRTLNRRVEVVPIGEEPSRGSWAQR